MHQTVANAVVAAMQQFHHTQPLLSSQTTPITPSSPSPVPTTHPVQIPVATTTSTSTIPTSNVNNNINQLNHLSSTIPTQTSTVQSFTHNYIPPTSPMPNLPQQGSEADLITLADLVQMSSTPKCSFPIFTKMQNIFEWKTACLLELAGSSKPSHCKMVMVDHEGHMTFASHLTLSDNQELF